MPYLVSTSFDRCLERITLTDNLEEIAKNRKNSIANLLGNKFNILDILVTGSIPRGTALKGASDLDVMVVLHYGNHVEGKTPIALLESVREVLSGYNARIVKKNGQAVTLYFQTWPNVDIVPAKRVTKGNTYDLHIPDANTGNWIITDPIAHDKRMRETSNYNRRLIRLVKCWNRGHSGYFQSFHIEKVALDTWIDQSDNSEDSWPWRLRCFFDSAVRLTEPNSRISESYDVDDWSALRNRLRTGYQLSQDAWHAAKSKDFERAITICRDLIGDNFPSYG